MLVGDYIEYWYNTYRIMRHAPSTSAFIKNYIQIHIKDSDLGRMDIREAKTVDYQIFLRDLLMHGNKCKLKSLNTFGNPLSCWSVARNFKNVCLRLGMSSDIHLHCTRHSWATNMIQCGATISDIQALCGWTTPDMLLSIYAHTVRDSHRKAVMKLYKAVHALE